MPSKERRLLGWFLARGLPAVFFFLPVDAIQARANAAVIDAMRCLRDTLAAPFGGGDGVFGEVFHTCTRRNLVPRLVAKATSSDT